MDFWKIVGIVFLICTIINLPFFVIELRKDKQKKQMKDPEPVLVNKPDLPRTEKRRQDPPGTFTLEYHFRYRQETDLEQINADLARYELSRLELVDSKGYLATETTTDAKTGEKTVRYWCGLDDCVFRCTLARFGMGHSYRIDTMTMEKTTDDCAAFWRTNNPDRTIRTMVELTFPEARAIVVLHHKKAESAATPAPVPSKKAPPVRADSNSKYCCGRPGKDTLVFWYEDGTLYIEGQGRLRCGQWHWLRSPIRHVVIGPGCSAIGDFVFQHCRTLETVVLPDTLRTIGERAFAYCTGLREVTIPDSVTGIGKGAFDYCKNLSKVYLPRNLAQIHSNTFRFCEALEDVQIPDSVHYIGARAFYRVKSVNNLPRNLGNWGTRTSWYSTRQYGLGEAAFAYVGLPSHIEIPDRISVIPEAAFRGCKTLTSVKFPRYYLREIGNSAFFECTSLQEAVIPDTVTRIGGCAFADCVKLEVLKLPEKLKQLDPAAFASCPHLTEIIIPYGITCIPLNTFSRCAGLVCVSIPDSVTEIGPWGFEGCTALKALHIPSTVNKIGRLAFMDVPNIIYHGPARSDNNWGALSRNGESRNQKQ